MRWLGVTVLGIVMSRGGLDVRNVHLLALTCQCLHLLGSGAISAQNLCSLCSAFGVGGCYTKID